MRAFATQQQEIYPRQALCSPGFEINKYKSDLLG